MSECPNYLYFNGEQLYFGGEMLAFGTTDCPPGVEFSLSRRSRGSWVRRIPSR